MGEFYSGDPGDETDRGRIRQRVAIPGGALPELDIRIQEREEMSRREQIEAVLATIPEEQNVKGYVDPKGKKGFQNPVRPVVGRALERLSRDVPLRRGVELGTALGRSGLMFALGGVRELDTVEFEKWAADTATENFAKAGVSGFNVHNMDSGTFTAEFDKPIDFVFIDHAKERYLEDLQNLEPQLSENALVLMDNTFNRAAECADAVAYVAEQYPYCFMFTEPPTGKDGVTTGLLVASKSRATATTAFKTLMDVRAEAAA